MKCKYCGHEFREGSFCPRCGTKYEALEENPYAENYTEYPPSPNSEQLNEQSYLQQKYNQSISSQSISSQSNPPQNVPTQNAQPQNAQPQNSQSQNSQAQNASPQNVPPQNAQGFQPNYPPQGYYPPYPYPPQPQAQQKKGMTAGKIVALVASVLVGLMILQFAVPFGFFGIMACVENNHKNSKSVSSTPYPSDSVVTVGDFSYEIKNISYTDTFEKQKAKENEQFIQLTIDAKNVTSTVAYMQSEFSMYADDIKCAEQTDYDNYYDFYGSDINPDKIARVELCYKIPKDAKNITLSVTTYQTGFLTDTSDFSFKIK